MGIDIGGRTVGSGVGCFVIAEVAQGHDGSLGTAHAYIDSAAGAGADAVKFQTHLAHAESTPSEPWRVKFSPQDDTRYEYWQRMEFTEEQWRGLADHAAEAGLQFLSSAFSIEAVEMLERVGINAWKVASGEVSNRPLIERMFATGKPVLASTGMSGWAEIATIVEQARHHDGSIALFQCTSAYPCPPEKTGLNVIPDMRRRFGVPVGLSDHSGTMWPALGAVPLGLDLLEVHLTFSREMFGPDVPSSLTTDEFRSMVEGIRWLERATSVEIDKDAMADELAPMRALFTKSVVVRDAAPAGTVLTAEALVTKKPGTGIPANRIEQVVGRTLAIDVDADTVLDESMLR